MMAAETVMTSSKNIPREVESAFGGLSGDVSAFPDSLSLDMRARHLYMRTAQPRRTMGPLLNPVRRYVEEVLGSDAARMISLEGGSTLVSHVLIQPWTRNIPSSLVDQVRAEVIRAFGELGYRDFLVAPFLESNNEIHT